MATEQEIQLLKEYIENLERLLSETGYKKLCSCCDLACIPIWGRNKSECCEVCVEAVEVK